MRIRFLAMLTLVIAGLFATGCSLFEKDREATPNQAPSASLTSGPVDGDPDAFYRVHFYWSGYDPDGQVVAFEYLLTNDEVTGSLVIDTNIYETLAALGYSWTRTEAFEARFVVSADQHPDLAEPADSIYWQPDPDRFHAQHSFFVRSVDNEGAISRQPAHRSFTATTLAPEVRITDPEDTGSMGGVEDFSRVLRFRWTGRDSLQDGSAIDPDSSRSAILRAEDFPADPLGGSLVELPDSIWSAWRGWNTAASGYEAGGQEELLDLGAHFPSPVGDEFVYLVQAKDEAGAVTSHYQDGVNLRRLRIVGSLSPRLLLDGDIFGQRAVNTSTELAFAAAAGSEHALRWAGSAEHYGSEIDAYRYGWDIQDLDDDAQWSSWSLQSTSTVFVHAPGVHRLHIQCRDLAGAVLWVEIEFDFVPVTFERDLLLVDDYSNLASADPAFGWPDGPEHAWGVFTHSDDDQKLFWDAVLAEYTSYDPGLDFYRVTPAAGAPPYAQLGAYRHAVWEVREESPGESALYTIAGFRDIYAAAGPGDYLSNWIELGGQLLLCGHRPLRAMLPVPGDMGDANYQRKLPLAFLHELGYSEGSAEDSQEAVERFLPWRHFGIDVVAAGEDQTPRDYEWTGDDWRTYRIFWGLAGIGYGGQEQASYPIGSAWAPADTIRFRPEVYQWFAEAGGILIGAMADQGDLDCELIDCISPPPLYGLGGAEIYNWDFFAQAASPTPDYRAEAYLPFLSYRPADATTRWGAAPTAAHPVLTPTGANYYELGYSSGGAAFHALGVIGQLNPDRPSVLLGFTPYFLAEDEAQGLIGHVLTDVMGLER